MATADRDLAYLEGMAGAIEATDLRTAPVHYHERKGLGLGITALRQLDRMSRADLAFALGVPEQRIADLESGSIPLTRGA